MKLLVLSSSIVLSSAVKCAWTPRCIGDPGFMGPTVYEDATTKEECDAKNIVEPAAKWESICGVDETAIEKAMLPMCLGPEMNSCTSAMEGPDAECKAQDGSTATCIEKTMIAGQDDSALCYPEGAEPCNFVNCNAIAGVVLLSAFQCPAITTQVECEASDMTPMLTAMVVAAGCEVEGAAPPMDMGCLCNTGGTFTSTKQAECGMAAAFLPVLFGQHETCDLLAASAEAQVATCKDADTQFAPEGTDCEARDKDTCDSNDGFCEWNDPSLMLSSMAYMCCEGGTPPSAQCLCDAGVWDNDLPIPGADTSDPMEPSTCGDLASMLPMMGGCAAKDDPEGVGLMAMVCCAYTKDEKKEKCENTEATACIARCKVCMEGDVELDANGGDCDTCKDCSPYIGCMIPTAPDPTPSGASYPTPSGEEQNAGMALAAAPAVVLLAVAAALA